jgi:elongation factor Ts
MQSARAVALRGAATALHHCAAAVSSVAPVRAAAAAARVPAVLFRAPCRFLSTTAAAPAKASMAAIKQLRERTGAPITECKDALSGVLSEGKVDATNEAAVMDAAVDWLRKKGVSTAAKKSGRVASEGLVALQASANGRAASLVDVNSETDFAARNTLFRGLCTSVSRAALQMAEQTAIVGGEVPLASLQSTSCVDPTASNTTVPVSTAVTNVVSTLRENVQVRRVAGLAVQQGVVGTYVHNAVENDAATATAGPTVRLGRQAAIVALEVSGAPSTASAEAVSQQLQSLANKLAMQVVAATPRYASRADVPAELVEAERAVLTEQANAAPVHVPGQPPKKPQKPKDAAQLAKMMDGKSVDKHS